MDGVEPWNPWAAVRERGDIIVLFQRVPGAPPAVHQLRGRTHVLLIDPAGGRVERNHLLAHELVHIERGGGCASHGWMPSAWGPVVRREEERVETIVAQRLVPVRALAQLAWKASELEGPLDAHVVAERFDVPIHVAERALWLLDPLNVPAPPTMLQRLAG
jgi:hypothetical protein